MITGAGEERSTPDILVDMLDVDSSMNNPKPCSYIAVATGEKQLNMAKVVNEIDNVKNGKLKSEICS